MERLGELITRKIIESGMRKIDLIRALGYRNRNRGLRRLDTLIKEDDAPKAFIQSIVGLLHIDGNEIKKAVEYSNRKIEKEQARKKEQRENFLRTHFRPHLYVEHERSRPKSITIVAFVGVNQFKIVELPDHIENLNLKSQFNIVSNTIKSHYEEIGKDDPMFGKAIYYLYRKTYDISLKFDVKGNFVGEILPKPVEVKAEILVGGKPLPVLVEE